MKRLRTIAVVSALFLGLCALPSMAQRKNQQRRTTEEAFARIDKNNDKKLSLEEFVGKKTGDKATKSKDQFKRLDKNNDRSLTLEEFKAGRKRS